MSRSGVVVLLFMIGAFGLVGAGAASLLRYHRRVADEHAQPLEAQLEEIGSRLAWVRDYL